MQTSRMRLHKASPYLSIVNDDKQEDFQKVRVLYIINNTAGFKEKLRASKQFTSYESEPSEDVELLLKNLMNKKEIEEHKFFQETYGNDYESLSNLRIKRLRESLESPVFGSKASDYQSQRNLIRGMTVTSKDELEHAFQTKPINQIFQKQKRHFSFNESENSSFPSSYNTSIARQESLNSKATNQSNRTPNFNLSHQVRIRKSASSSKKGSVYKSPIGFKNHLKSIAHLVGADKNVLPLPNILYSVSINYSNLFN